MQADVVQDAVAGFEASDTPTRLVDAFVAALRPYGAIGFTAADFSVEDRADLILYTSMPDIFTPLDTDSPWWSDDPVVARLGEGVLRPFDVEDAWSNPLPSAAARWDALTELRLNRGWVFPVSKPGYVGGVHVITDPDDYERFPDHLSVAHPIATYFHAFMTEMDPDADGHYIVRNTLGHRAKAERRTKLAPREVDCLRWCAFGKTAEETAIIEGLSVHTVRDYLRSAMAKLDARNQAQAVARGLKYGLFRI